MSYESHFTKESIDNIKRIADVQEKLLEINNVDTVELKKEILIGIEQGYSFIFGCIRVPCFTHTNAVRFSEQFTK